jgi:IS605 OrfB family transposase
VSSYRKYKKKLAREQRALARKEKYSNNWRKQKARIGRLHAKIARIRNDFLHKTSTTISKTHALVVLEDLSVKSMSRSARGTVNAPGRKVRAKAGLNTSILDQGWAEFRRQLEYKQTWRGGDGDRHRPVQHEPDMPHLRAHLGREPEDSGRVPVRPLRLRCGRRCERGAQHLSGGTTPSLPGGYEERSRAPGPGPTVSEVA